MTLKEEKSAIEAYNRAEIYISVSEFNERLDRLVKELEGIELDGQWSGHWVNGFVMAKSKAISLIQSYKV